MKRTIISSRAKPVTMPEWPAWLNPAQGDTYAVHRAEQNERLLPKPWETDFFIAYHPTVAFSRCAAGECLAHDVDKWTARMSGEYSIGPIEDIGEDPNCPGVYLLRCTVTPKSAKRALFL